MNGKRNRDRVQCREVFSPVQQNDGTVKWQWVWCVLAPPAQPRFVRGPESAPPGAKIIFRALPSGPKDGAS